MTDIDQVHPNKIYPSIPSAPSIEMMPLHNDKDHS